MVREESVMNALECIAIVVSYDIDFEENNVNANKIF